MLPSYRQAPAIVARRIGDEMALVPVRCHVGDLDNVYTLNAAGALLWRLLARPQTRAQLSDALTEAFAVTPAAAQADAGAFLAELARLNLVTSVPEEPCPTLMTAF